MQKEQWQDGTGNYIKISVKEEENYGDKVFSFQDIKGFLPMEIRRINGKAEVVYNISGKMSLRDYLNKNDFSLKEIRKIFLQLFDMTDRVEEYLLDCEGILINADDLYVDIHSGELEGIYRSECKKNITESVSCLLEAIMEKMNQKDKELVFFIYGMHKQTKEYNCTREMLRSYVLKAKEEEKMLVEQSTKVYSEPTFKREPTSSFPKKIVIKGCLLPGMILAAGVTFPSVLWWMGMFQKPLSGELDWGKLIGIVAFFLAVSGYGAWKTMPDIQKNEREKLFTFHKEDSKLKNVCLIPQKGREEPIPIKQFPYWFGKTMGEVKTKIFQEDGNVLIMDEESVNGTFHNERRLVSWQKIPLKDGDLISVDGRDYVVEITSSAYVI